MRLRGDWVPEEGDKVKPSNYRALGWLANV